MNSLVKKLIVPFLISARLCLPFSIDAEEKEEEPIKQEINEEFEKTNWMGLGIGYCTPYEKSVRDIYGDMIRLRASVSNDYKNLRFESAVNYLRKSGNPYEFTSGNVENFESDSEISILGSEILLKYMIGDNNFSFYAGGGINYLLVNEKLNASGVIGGEYFSESHKRTLFRSGPCTSEATPNATALSYSIANSAGKTFVFPTTQNETLGLFSIFSILWPTRAQWK